MTLFDFAHEHIVVAVFLALLAFALPITIIGLIVGRPRAAPKYSAEDRAALTQASALLRKDARDYDARTYGRDDRVEVATALERMAGR